MRKTILLFIGMMLQCLGLYAQSIGQEHQALAAFLKRMYLAAPFEGVKIVEDYDHQYLISVISLEKAKYPNPSVMNRVATVKAQAQASNFINGARIDAETIIHTTETKDSSGRQQTITETIEKIKMNSSGFVQGMQLLHSFDASEPRTVFVYSAKLQPQTKP